MLWKKRITRKKDSYVEDLDDSDDDKKNGPPNFQKLHSNYFDKLKLHTVQVFILLRCFSAFEIFPSLYKFAITFII